MSILGKVAYLALLLFLSQVQVEFQVQEEAEGCRRRAVFRVLYCSFPDYGGLPKIFLFDGIKILVDYSLAWYVILMNILYLLNS